MITHTHKEQATPKNRFDTAHYEAHWQAQMGLPFSFHSGTAQGTDRQTDRQSVAKERERHQLFSWQTPVLVVAVGRQSCTLLECVVVAIV